jgi:hypothetical protein
MIRKSWLGFACVVMLSGAWACGSDEGTQPEDVVGDEAITEVAGDEGVTPEVTPEVCTPACTNKDCGDDGCGGVCGTCDAGDVCNASGKCEACKNPTTWGPVAMVATGVVPKAAADVEAKCTDYSGDGKGDNALAVFADVINAELQGGIDYGFYVAALEFVGVTDWTNQATFTVNGLPAGLTVAGAGGSDIALSYIAYLKDTCLPQVSVPASLSGGKLTIGPIEALTAKVPYGGKVYTGTIEKVVVKGDLTHGADGVSLANGVLTGLLTKAGADALVAVVEELCAKDPPISDQCDKVPAAKQLLPGAYDLDLDKDGTKDAASLCTFFTMKPAKVVGYAEGAVKWP